jgi:acyl-CoA thioester hydrolase
VSTPFRYYLRVRYGECDAQKVVFNARYADYVDLATVEFLRALGLGPQVISGALDYQLVKQTLEWKAPAHFDDVLELSVAATRLGNTSFTLGTTFRIAGSPAVIATAETVYVQVDAHSLRKQPLDGTLRQRLEAGTATVCDHAGWRAAAP